MAALRGRRRAGGRAAGPAASSARTGGRRASSSGGGDAPVDFGLVGDVDGFDLRAARRCWTRGRAVPVLACLGGGAAGEVLNINADVVASQLAVAVRRRRRWWPSRRWAAFAATRTIRRRGCARLTVAEARAAIADGTVQGGMIPKLEEAFAPLAAGVGAVHIVAPGEIATGAGSRRGRVGTLLVP